MDSIIARAGKLIMEQDDKVDCVVCKEEFSMSSSVSQHGPVPSRNNTCSSKCFVKKCINNANARTAHA